MGKAGQQIRLEKGQLWWVKKSWGDGHGDLLRVVEVADGGRSGRVRRLDKVTLELDQDWPTPMTVTAGRTRVMVEGRQLMPWTPTPSDALLNAGKLGQIVREDLTLTLAHLDRLRQDAFRFWREMAAQAPEKPQARAVEVGHGADT